MSRRAAVAEDLKAALPGWIAGRVLTVGAWLGARWWIEHAHHGVRPFANQLGLFAWDGKSRGTLRNIRGMAEQGKPSAVYVSPTKTFVTIRNAEDASALSPGVRSTSSPSGELFSDAWQLPKEAALAASPPDSH